MAGRPERDGLAVRERWGDPRLEQVAHNPERVRVAVMSSPKKTIIINFIIIVVC